MRDNVPYKFRCNIDYFLLNQKDLEQISILPEIFCDMHIALCILQTLAMRGLEEHFSSCAVVSVFLLRRK